MMKIMTAMYTMRRGGAYDRLKTMVEAFLERSCKVHCLSLTPVQIEIFYLHSHVIFYPFKNGLMGKLAAIFIFSLWSIWVGGRNKIDLLIAIGSLYAFI